MDVVQREPETEGRRAAADLKGLLQPGVLVVEGGETGGLGFVDARAMDLLGCSDRAALERLWSRLRGRLEEAGFLGAGAGDGAVTLDGAADTVNTAAGARRLAFDWRPNGSGGVLLVHDAEVGESLTADLRQASLLRSVAQITPAVAHDLRAPINAMVFNIEVLKETIAAGKGADPAGRDRQLRYVNVLREELHRLHQAMETYIAQISPRGDRDEILDLREPVGELAALLVGPARKQQARVVSEIPAAPVTVSGNRALLRQALLHVAVAALTGVPRDGALEIRVEGDHGRARVRIGTQGGAAAPAMPASGRPGFGVSASPQGTQAQLWVARSILADLGGEVRILENPGAPPAYEVELAATQDSGSSGEKE